MSSDRQSYRGYIVMLKKFFAVVGVIAVTSVIGPVSATAVAATSVPAVSAKVQGLTSGQANAIRSAKAYLRISAFSRSGLINQLKFEGYSTRNATYAVDHITVSWSTQAYRSAKAYLRLSPFSRSGLIGQLKFEGYTSSQARYGANRAL